jgi:toluene monooxygenase system protein A
MDYMTVREQRSASFKEFMEEWIVDQFFRTLDEFGLKKPWYWGIFLDELEIYHHMLYAAAYTYRATVWFDLTMPSPTDRAWLRQKYPKYWDDIEAVWEQLGKQWQSKGPGPDHEMAMHAAVLPAFCDLCQFPLSAGTPRHNTAAVATHGGKSYIFCSEPCRWIFEHEPERYAGHKDVVKRVLSGEAPADLGRLLTEYFQLTPDTWGKDACSGDYQWLRSPRAASSPAAG